ncbi:hypothetical protein HW555_007152 [Spodoptera exigua]|uniref:Uncharacterized protein n=1 Tax=Spodoptera exigua TaxID=7107 RepID=A0A835GDL7_SPOEX|nr:hypothetical protein HW555_007152 [Spodoptera exigua]
MAIQAADDRALAKFTVSVARGKHKRRHWSLNEWAVTITSLKTLLHNALSCTKSAKQYAVSSLSLVETALFTGTGDPTDNINAEPTVGVIFENIILTILIVQITITCTDTFREQLENFKLYSIRAQNPTVKKPNKGKFENVDVKVNETNSGAHINRVETE